MKKDKLMTRTTLAQSRKRGVLIIECTDRSDPGSEGRFLSHMFDLMNVQSQYVEVRTPDQLIALMECSPYKYIHITTHGCVSTSTDKFLGWWTPDGDVNRFNLGCLEEKMFKTIIISTACRSADKKFGRYVVDRLGCSYYIAPKQSPKFHNSIMFSHIFYHKHFILEQNTQSSYEAYDKNYKNPHKFSIYVRKRSNKKIQRTRNRRGTISA